MNPRAGVRDGVVGHRVRRLRLQAGHGHAAPLPWLERTAMVQCRHGVARRHAGRSLAPPDPEAPAGAAGRARVDGEDRLGAGVHPVPRQVRGGPREGYHDLVPANEYNVDYSIFGTTIVEDVIRPIRLAHGQRRPRGRGLEGRVQLRPARGQLPVLRRAQDGRQPRDLQERRQGDRLAARRALRSSRSSTSARGTRATSTARSGTATRACSPTRTGTAARPCSVVHRRAAAVHDAS